MKTQTYPQSEVHNEIQHDETPSRLVSVEEEPKAVAHSLPLFVVY